MVELSLRKARTNWKQLSSPTRTNAGGSTASGEQLKTNPYQNLKVPTDYAQLPTIDSKERDKVGTLMQRRLSFHAPKYGGPATDYAAVPLPYGLDGEQSYAGKNDFQPISRQNRSTSSVGMQRLGHKQAHSVPLRQVLSNPDFDAKEYVSSTLGNASALEIDQFTSELNDLALEVTDEVKENVSRSYTQVLQVNKDLKSASTELKQLRSSVGELQEVMGDLSTMAEKRLQLERGPTQNSRTEQQQQQQQQQHSLLPPAKASKKRDRTSVFMLEKMWKSELSTLFRVVEGAQKFIAPVPGRHILLENSNWYEMNAATLKPLKAVHIFLLSDMIMIAAKNQENRQHELVVCYCHTLRDTTISPQAKNRISLNFANRRQCLIQTHKSQEYEHFVSAVRGAKDDLNVIFEAEEENTRKIRDSFTYLQATQNTPGRELTLSPTKGHARNSSLGNAASGPGSEANESFSLQVLSSSLKYPSQAVGGRRNADVLSHLDGVVENFDIVFARHNFKAAIQYLNQLEESLTSLNKDGSQKNQILLNLVRLKVANRNELLAGKLTQLISAETSNFSNLIDYLRDLISLNYKYEALDLFLQNRTKYVHELIIKVGSFQNSTHYLTQIAVIRFQTLKTVVASVKEIFDSTDAKFSSTLVSWCSSEVDQHFSLINKHLMSIEMIPPSSIKSSRRQIDELKSVGLDFVYKLDDFIRKNAERIG
ncbi:LAME_0F03334g1_1 [Lachancea meyersii CBS 8951]|uniref:Exocyst complex component EXO84 n=1 Tax=Lachancea meyersii CBS 8951 TaxID=1266667 RepID=A0A1G4JR57_9SACH|nr:LAME_0F03334g1_1 [Lachancea meyersii CBS 8951]